jgi:hypothetical protein
MRTVTFRDGKVKAALKDFALAWTNIAGDATCGESFRHEPGEAAGDLLRGNGEHNMQVLLLTPRGEIAHILAGYCGPKDMLEELAFAKKAVAMTSEKLAALHAERAKELDPGTPTADMSPSTELGASWCGKHWRHRAHTYMSTHALLPVADYRAEDLVGRGKSFFGSRRQ